MFKLDPAGHETILHNFMYGTDGSQPDAGVSLDMAGNIYGTAGAGGMGGGFVFGHGVVYKLDPAGNETILYAFTGGLDGGSPIGGVTLGSAGNIYGTTWSGGPPSGDYPGVVYKLDRTGHETVVYPFTGFADGGDPLGTLIFDSAGNIYGVTQFGGQGPCPYFGCGVVFEVNPAGQERVLYSFTGGADGSEPTAGVIRDSVGNLYGTTSGGGAVGAVVRYKIAATAIAQ